MIINRKTIGLLAAGVVAMAAASAPAVAAQLDEKIVALLTAAE